MSRTASTWLTSASAGFMASELLMVMLAVAAGGTADAATARVPPVSIRMGSG